MSTATLFPLLFHAIGTPLFAWVYAAASIKRLHDRDNSGWWMVPFFIAPGLFRQFEDRLGDSDAVAFLGLVVSILCIWGFVEIFYLRGTRGPNRFGPDPLAPVSAGRRWSQQEELEFVARSAGPPPASHVKRGA
jgi:uncharacterized membrane protein YhaH (DUF805 family)